MGYRALGRTGLHVSPLCLGAMMFGAGRNSDHDKGRVSVMTFRYHVGRVYSGERVQVTRDDGLLYVVIATHARRHLIDDDVAFLAQPKAKAPTKGDEVLRKVDPTGAVSFAGTNYRVGNAYRGWLAGVRIVGDTVQITVDGVLIRTHQSRHDKSKEYSAFAQPKGKPRRTDVASVPEP
jgi:hypothetical protein